MKYLALDIGSSFIKYAVLDIDGKRIGSVNRMSVPKPDTPSDTRYEIAVDVIWQLIKKIISETVRKEDVAGIVLSTQMHGFILADDDKIPLTPYISWQDSRCLEIHNDTDWISELGSTGCTAYMKNAGVCLKPNISMCNLYTVMHEMQLFGRKIHFCTLGSYLIWKLTGQNTCHITNGAPTGLVDIVNGCWNQELIENIGYGDIIFPKLEKELEVCGTYQLDGRQIAVFPDLGDHQVCVLGSGMDSEWEISINIGTAGLLSVITTDYQWNSGEVRPYFDGRFLNTQRGLFGGRDLEVLARFLSDVAENVTGQPCREDDVWRRISNRPEKKNRQYKHLEIKPDFFVDGWINGISNDNFNFTSLMESVYANVALEYEKAFLEIVSEKDRYTTVVFSGGAARKTHWMKESIAERLKCEWREAKSEDEAIQGLFRVALVCSGTCGSLEETAVCI